MTRLPPIAQRLSGKDPYVWLEERDAPQVVDYLRAENAFLEDQLAPQKALREQLFEEIKGRIRETDLSLPTPLGPWLYYQRTLAGDEYPRYYRCPRPADTASWTVDEAAEQLLLDPNALVGDGFIAVGSFSISPDHSRLAYSLDFKGDENYSLYVKELADGQIRPLPFEGMSASLTWANDNQTLFMVELDETQRPYALFRFSLETGRAEKIFTETDERFFLYCYRSSSERQLILLLTSKTTSEAWILDAARPADDFVCMAPRQDGHEYYPDHGKLEGQWSWLIRSNQTGINFALFKASETQTERQAWQEYLAHSNDLMLEGLSLNADALTLSLREAGLPIIEVRPSKGSAYRVQLPDEVYSLSLEDALEFDSPVVRLRYEALNRPAQIRQLHLQSGAQQLLKETPVEGPFAAEAYTSQRLWARSPDGVQVPISLVGRREVLAQVAQGRPAPLYLYGYGAYGESLDPWFSHARLSLLERGFIFAIAHVRGGGELGEAWYQAGKLEHKINTFSDFIACTEYLIQKGYSTVQQVVISGGSAGGLLIGAVLNQRPELFAAAIADVPFVDVLNSMLNPELPLTVTEYEEWGNPEDPEVYQRIQAYAPYENVRAQRYPALLVVAGYHDTRVQYWEAAKWVAKLRATKTDNQLLLLKTDLKAGHSGMSGRYQVIQDVALEYAFLLKVLALAE